jgi:RHS repeat-associated protein
VAESEHGYDAAGRLISIAHVATASGSTFAETHSYTYDGGNRLTSYSNIFGGVDADYDYDPTDQLTEVDYTGQNDESYTYDANGNRQSAGSETYSVGPCNQLLSDGVYEYGYDDEGNLIERWESNSPGWRTYYTWDHRNRLVHVSKWDGEHEVLIVDFVYDAFNQLVFQVTNEPFEGGETSTVFVHDNGQVVLQFDKWGSEPEAVTADDLSHRYLWGDAVDQLFADEQVDWTDTYADGPTMWALTDNLGSVRDVVDSNGKLRIHRDFDGFGNIVDESHYNASGAAVTSNQTDYVDEAFAFTGRYFDKGTGLQNNLNRWYDPAVGRWLSEDPIGFQAGDANLYRYVENEPTDRIDPWGLDGGRPNPPPVFAPGDPSNYPPQHKARCEYLAKTIQKIYNDIQKRIEEIMLDKLGLPGSTPNDDTWPSQSKRGHWNMISELKSRLADLVLEYNQKCRPAACPDPVPQPQPMPIVPIIGIPGPEPAPAPSPWWKRIPWRTVPARIMCPLPIWLFPPKQTDSYGREYV